ncbi:Uncharacterized protein OBRU01_06797 [Operophtera brumata]|uniref:XPG N-terminal domain-containing protein n=1 Tax=Operophtera brumata TaxID=104452 RepID=A0A0L7LK57_OPEBR|nr:Uncharacterized protein OBRU01_06797 [Operophtera brumata]
MGIKGLWTVLTPFSEKKSLHEIRGETLAVDLSGWVNLFFRTIYLLLADITPIFVLEGDAPPLKQNCETLLKCMGVSCIKGRGEAEATCAELNAQARRVYRNFSVSSSAGGGAMQGSVDCYEADKMFESNGFGRKKMVALALLCGCDYGVGACGTSINTVLTFLHTVPENDVIPRAKVAEVKRELSLRARALSCGTLFPEPNVMKEFLNSTPEKIDLNSLKKPTPSLIQFVKVMSYKLDWTERYCVEKFLPLLTKWHLQEKVPCVPSFEVVWEDVDGQYDALIPDNQYEGDEDRSLPWTSIERQDLMRQYYPDLVYAYEESVKKPTKEKKARGRKKKDEQNPDKPKRKYIRKPKDVDIEILNDSLRILELNCSKTNTSVSVSKLKRKIKKNTKKGSQKTIESFLAKKRKRSHIESMMSLRNSLKNMSLMQDIPNENSKDKENKRTTDNWLSILDKTGDDENESDLSDIIERMVTKPRKTKTVKVDNKLVRLVFDNYSTPKKLRKSILTEIQNRCSTPKDSPRRKSVMNLKSGTNSLNNSVISKVNTSFFFDKLTEDRDAFEMSLGHKSAVINLDDTVDYSLPDVCL